jgi:hypothetical protein
MCETCSGTSASLRLTPLPLLPLLCLTRFPTARSASHTPVYYAVRQGHPEVERLVRDAGGLFAGADLDSRHVRGDSSNGDCSAAVREAATALAPGALDGPGSGP